MKQYKEKPTFKSGCMPLLSQPHIKNEALWGSSYSKVARDSRRTINKSAISWWREQIGSEGMPHQFHCWGW